MEQRRGIRGGGNLLGQVVTVEVDTLQKGKKTFYKTNSQLKLYHRVLGTADRESVTPLCVTLHLCVEQYRETVVVPESGSRTRSYR